MANLFEDLRRRMAPVSLGLWPSLANPAWNGAGALRLFPDRLMVSVDPAKVDRKLDAPAQARLKGRFLVQGLSELPATRVAELYTHRDMEDIARHGADWRATRLGQWLKACIEAGRPPFVRGAWVRTEAEIEAYYNGYLRMFESMRADGYRYEGQDHMCFGLTAEGSLVLVRRGTHRIAAARILKLARVSGRVTHLDRRFAEASVRKHPGLPVPQAIRRGIDEVLGPC